MSGPFFFAEINTPRWFPQLPNGRNVSETRDASWYRQEAMLARKKAAATIDPVLRDSYLQLAEAYEQLAQTLERLRPS